MSIPSNHALANHAREIVRPEGLLVVRLGDLELGGPAGAHRPDRFFVPSARISCKNPVHVGAAMVAVLRPMASCACLGTA